jgi:hypothetical protein
LQLVSGDLEDGAESDGSDSDDADRCEVWPAHWPALQLLTACMDQLELSLGGMGGVHYSAARSVNVRQEWVWLGLPKQSQSEVVGQYRLMEREALAVLNERQASKG